MTKIMVFGLSGPPIKQTAGAARTVWFTSTHLLTAMMAKPWWPIPHVRSGFVPVNRPVRSPPLVKRHTGYQACLTRDPLTAVVSVGHAGNKTAGMTLR